MGWKGETTILGGINQTMGRDWERRANKIEKRRAWKRSNKVMNEKEKRRKQRRQKTKEDMIWEFHEGDVYEG